MYELVSGSSRLRRPTCAHTQHMNRSEWDTMSLLEVSICPLNLVAAHADGSSTEIIRIDGKLPASLCHTEALAMV